MGKTQSNLGGGGGGGGFIKRIRLHLERMEMRGEGKVVEMY